MHLVCTNEYAPHRIDEMVAFMLGPRLWIPRIDYPDIYDWAQKAHRQLQTGSKRAMVAFSHNNVVGILVYQRHQALTDTVELKHLTVRPDMRGRYLASFLLRNAERESILALGGARFVCDAKAQNSSICQFLLRHHYQAVSTQDLYKKGGGADRIFMKRYQSGPVLPSTP